jgi:hypothetical protein
VSSMRSFGRPVFARSSSAASTPGSACGGRSLTQSITRAMELVEESALPGGLVKAAIWTTVSLSGPGCVVLVAVPGLLACALTLWPRSRRFADRLVLFAFIQFYCFVTPAMFAAPWLYLPWEYAALCSLLVVVWGAAPVPGEFDGSAEWPAFRRSSFVSSLSSSDAHPWRHVEHGGRLDPRQRYIFAGSPHGTIPVGWGLKFAQHSCTPMGLMASVIFRLPISRTLSLWMGAVNASTSAIDTALDHQQRSAMVIPGGISVSTVPCLSACMQSSHPALHAPLRARGQAATRSIGVAPLVRLFHNLAPIE